MLTRLFFFLVASTAWAQPPASVANLVYYEKGTTVARFSYSLGVVLQEDGTARGLFYLTGSSSSGPFTTGDVTDGTWQYRKIDDERAEFTINRPSGGGPFAAQRTLIFTSATSGSALQAGASAGFQLAEASLRSPLVNCSNRSFVPGGGAAFTGFVVTGDRERAVLVRAVGPGLATFGVPNRLADPKLTLTQGTRMLAQNDDWQPGGGTSVQQTGAFVGAFPLPAGSKDAATVVTLPAGAYVAEVTGGTPTDAGQVLIEVYLLP
jgi:hypothetical protein